MTLVWVGWTLVLLIATFAVILAEYVLYAWRKTIDRAEARQRLVEETMATLQQQHSVARQLQKERNLAIAFVAVVARGPFACSESLKAKGEEILKECGFQDLEVEVVPPGETLHAPTVPMIH